MRVVILDDHPDNLVLLRGMLESRGFSVESAVNGLQGLSLVQRSVPDLIISDILMPQMDGFTFCRVVKGIEGLKHIPFVFYTATYLDKEDERLGLALGAVRYIHKPTEPVEFLRQIDKVIADYQLDDLQDTKRSLKTDTRLELLHQELLAQKLDKKIRDVDYLRLKEELILDTVSEGIMGIDLDGDHTLVNKAAAKMLGHEPEEMIGRHTHSLWHHTSMDGTPLSEAECPIYRSIKEQTPIINTEGKFWRKDGSSFLVDYSCTPLVEHDEHKGTVVVFKDITQRKEAESQLQALRLQFDLFMQHLPYVAVIKDDEEKILYANPATYDYLNWDPVGSTSLDIFGEKAAEEIFLLTDKARIDGRSEGIVELELDQKKYVAQILSFSIPQDDEKIYIGSIYIDITQLQEANKELADKEEIMIAQSRHAAMGEMISMIAHQWRQPITVIAMEANNILIDIDLEEESTEEFRKQARGILKQTEHLSKTIDDFRDFFRPDKKAEEIRPETVMSEAERIIGKSLQSNAIQLDIENKSDYTVETYSRELLQVYINLLKNAKEALVENQIQERKIEVSISDDAKHIITTICDNGGGIDDAIINKIYEPYFSTKDEKTGTGLGLYMSKTIIEKHLHGTIDVSNIKDAQDRYIGVCFTISLPRKG